MIDRYRKLPTLGPGDHNTVLRQVERRLGDYAYDVATEAGGEERLAVQHRHMSRLAAVAARDGVSWNDQLASLGAWSTANSPTVSGGRFFGATTPSVISVATRPISFGSRFRIVVPVAFKDGTATDRMTGVFVTTDTAAAIAASGSMANSVAMSIDADPAGARARKLFATAFGLEASPWSQMAAGDRDLDFVFAWDEEDGLGISVRSTDGAIEHADWVSIPDMNGIAWRPTHVGLYSTDNRGSTTATGYGPVGFRASLAEIDPPAGVSRPQVQFGAPTPPTNPERTRFVTPDGYTSRSARDLFIVCHGGGQDVWHAKALADDFMEAGAIVGSGDFRGLASSMFAFGAPTSIDRVVDLYYKALERYRVRYVFLAGYSMGGQTVLQAVADGRIPGIKGAAIGNPAVDLHWVWEQRNLPAWAGDWPAIKAAWGVADDTEAAWNAATSALNPMTRPVSDFRGVPIWISSSPDDTTATEVDNALPFRDRVNAAVPGQVTHHVASGGHGDPSAWPHATILSWANGLI